MMEFRTIRSVAAALAVSLVWTAAPPPPNIIWLQADSMDGRLLDPTSTYFNKIKATAFKQNFLEQGVAMTRHYTNSPQCVPSRTSMMVSRLVSETDTANNGQGFARSTKTGALDSTCVSVYNRSTCAAFAERQNVSKTMLDVAAAAGYSLNLFGRFDVGAGILDDYPGTTGDGFHGGPTIDILARGAGLRGESDVEPWSSTSDNEADPYHHDYVEVEDAISWLTSTPPSAQPFFLWLGVLGPHPPYATNATWLTHVNESNVDAPLLPAWVDMHPYDVDMSTLKAVTLNYTETQLKTMRRTYWAACAEALHFLETVIGTAKRTGHLNNTVVIFTSDHGENSLEWRQDYKNSLREPSTRVPLVIAPFGLAAQSFPVPPGGSTVSAITSHLDILPTVAELMGATAHLPSGVRGTSLVPLLTPHSEAAAAAAVAARPDYAVFEFHSNLALTGSYGIRQGPWKLITFGHTFAWFNASTYTPQLYNVAADPFETTDVAGANPAVVAQLLSTLEAELGGGPGAIARIDALQMGRNYALFRDFIVPSAANLTNLFMQRFRGIPEAQLEARVAAWREAAALLPGAR